MDSIFEILLESLGTIFGLQGRHLRIIICGFIIMGVLVCCYLIWN